jgi:hypothetical protein
MIHGRKLLTPGTTSRRTEGLLPISENPGLLKVLGLVVNVIAGLVAVGSGIYLLAQYSETGPTWLEVIAHGSGAFFVACGLYMMGSVIAAGGER